MSRPSRRVRQRLAKRMTASSEAAIAAEQARKDRQSIGRIKSVLLENYGRLTNTSSRLSPDNLASLSYSAPGLHDGKLTIRGPWLPAVTRGAGRSKYGKPKFTPIMSDFDRREKAIKVLLMVVLLEACYKGSMQDRKEWLLETGPRVLRQFAPLFRLTVAGDDTRRSVRAQNSGSGKLKPRKGVRKTWQESKDTPPANYRLAGKMPKGQKIFLETGIPSGKHLVERTPKR